MRKKLTALTFACVLGAAAAVAEAAPIPVAQYTFTTQDDVLAFQKVDGQSCKRKWQGNQAMAITVGDATNSCAYRTSVVADSSDQVPDQGLSATASAGGRITPKLAKKAYAGIAVRESETAGYELRVLPNAHKWQVFRDPTGAGGPALMQGGAGKFIRMGSKPNSLVLRAFSRGTTSTSLMATVNGQNVFSSTDSGTDQPDGRRTVVTTGAKGTGAGTGIVGVFDDVTVQVPNPFG
jgi:hypothetical protein